MAQFENKYLIFKAYFMAKPTTQKHINCATAFRERERKRTLEIGL